MAVKPIPDGYPAVIPYLAVDGAEKAIEFYTAVLGAKERMRMAGPDGKIGHAELEIGASVIMLADEFPEMENLGPKHYGGSPVAVMVYVPDADKAYNKALELGAKSIMAMEDKFYGDRSGMFEDPFGHKFSVTTHIEDVSPEEMEKRMQAGMPG